MALRPDAQWLDAQWLNARWPRSMTSLFDSRFLMALRPDTQWLDVCWLARWPLLNGLDDLASRWSLFMGSLLMDGLS